MDMKEFKDQLPYVLGKLYANGVKGKQPSFVFSMFERFAKAHAQGAVFFGPIAVIPRNAEHSEWIIKDLREGWGFRPIDQPLTTDPDVEPTLEFVCRILRHYANGLRSKADCIEKLTDELCE